MNRNWLKPFLIGAALGVAVDRLFTVEGAAASTWAFILDVAEKMQ